MDIAIPNRVKWVRVGNGQRLEGVTDAPTFDGFRAQFVRFGWGGRSDSSRDICADEECEALGMSFSAARKALTNAPGPSRCEASANRCRA